MAPSRAPRRAAATKKKYTVDAFESIRDLVVASDDNGSDTSEPPEDDDEDPEVNPAIIEEAVEDVDDIVSEDNAFHTSDEDQARHEPGNSDIEETGSHVGVSTSTTSKKKNISTRHPKRMKPIDEALIHAQPAFDTSSEKPGSAGVARRGRVSRGIPEIYHNQGKESRVLYTFGPGQEDLIAHVKTRDKWLNDVTLPTRKTRKDGSGGLHPSFFYPEEKREKEIKQGWEWYYEQGGRGIFTEQQQSDILHAEQGRIDFEQSLTPSDPFLTGPPQQPKLFAELKPGDVANTGEAWVNASGHRDKQSWVVVAGGRIQCLEWVPNQTGRFQYLAVAVVPENKKRVVNKGSYAYAESSYGAHLQIWEFTSLASSTNESATIDFSKRPWLRAVLSFDWGMVKKLKWCPAPARESVAQTYEGELQLGLLAGVWDDGKVRVLDVRIPINKPLSTQYIYISKAAIESKPPGTICTCITWLSSGSIAVGCANGFVGIWDLAEALRSSAQFPASNPRPWFYEPIHGSYILSLVSCYPSRPHILITNSLDGYLRMTDLRSPIMDTIPAQRVRVAQTPVAWHEQIQAVISPDESFDLKSMILRIFYKMHTVGRTTALVSDMATSSLHASVLVAGVDGRVWILQPMRRMRDHKNTPYEQIWFGHEWRRGVTQPKPETQNATATEPLDPALDTEMPDAPPPSATPFQHYQPLYETPSTVLPQSSEQVLDKPTPAILANPLIRIVTGYKLSKLELGPESKPNTTSEGTIFQTTYDEQTAVTQVCWNPNLCCGTWAAAGTGSGLVLVDDLGGN
jgi:transcription factor C subunit 6